MLRVDYRKATLRFYFLVTTQLLKVTFTRKVFYMRFAVLVRDNACTLVRSKEILLG